MREGKDSIKEGGEKEKTASKKETERRKDSIKEGEREKEKTASKKKSGFYSHHARVKPSSSIHRIKNFKH